MNAGLVDIPLLVDPLGAIGVVEGPQLLPFEVRRFYFIRDVPAGATRGSHAHKQLNQIIIALHGSVNVDLDNGRTTSTFVLSSPTVGLHVPPGYWRTLSEFAPATVVAVLASREYDESDYLRDYGLFLEWSKHG